MRTRRFAAPLAALTVVAAVASGCGGSGTVSRPIETLVYVTGGQGIEFEFASDDDPCVIDGTTVEGTGIQAPNANHQFGDRVFETPHLFALENARQPVRAVIRNLSQTDSLQVFMILGQTPQISQPEGIIAPGTCKSLATNTRLEIPTPVPTPAGRGPQIRMEICAPRVNTDELDLSMPCEDSTADWAWGFFASVGDVKATNLSNCIVPAPPAPPSILSTCTSPATWFLEQPVDQAIGVYNVNGGQNPGNQPEAQVRVELYVNDTRESVASGVEAIVQTNLD